MEDEQTGHKPAKGAGETHNERIVYVMPEAVVATLPSDELRLLDLWRIVWKAKYFVIGLTAVFGIASIFYALTATEWYKAEVLLAPADENQTRALSGALGGLASLAGVNVNANNTAVALAVMRSRGFTEAFIRDQNLLPLMLPEDSSEGEEFGGPGDDVWDMRDAIKYFQDNVRSVSEDPNTGLITLSIEWKDPNLAAEWANLMVLRLNHRMRQEALEEAQRNIEYLRTELEQTNVITLHQSIGRLVESELQTLMLARGSEEFSFQVIDAAQVPNERSKPQRTLIVVVMTFIGGALAVLGVLIHNAARAGATSRDI